MKKQTYGSRSTIFLTELIIAILFFVLTSAVCLRMFARSHEISQSSFELNTAIIQATDIAELLKQFQKTAYFNENLEDFLKQEYTHAFVYNGFYHIYFDKDWVPCTYDTALYRIDIEDGRSSPAVYNITVRKLGTKEAIYHIRIVLHKPLRPSTPAENTEVSRE